MGFGSLFMDMSSELIHSLLPIFMVTTLGASMVTVGILEGVSEAAASVTKLFSGALSDYLGKRKFLMVFGYALAAFSKPVFPLASSVSWVFAARFMDRVGKGIRGAPRDALIVELTAPGFRGAAFGLRQALDTVGALLGPLLAVGLMILFASDIRMAMWFGVLPALIAVAVLVVYVHEPEHRSGPDATAEVRGARTKPMMADAARLPLRFWMVVALGAVFTLARFSEAFLVLRAHSVGLALSYVPLVMIVMNLLYAMAAFPAGAAADRVSARTLLFIGLALLIAADFVLAFASSPLLVFAGAALWGLHMALTQGLLSKLVADAAPAELLGTAFGIFHLVSGVAILLASVIAGALWSAIGAGATFLAGAAFAGLAAIGLLVVARR